MPFQIRFGQLRSLETLDLEYQGSCPWMPPLFVISL
jgi:hypothetical protein